MKNRYRIAPFLIILCVLLSAGQTFGEGCDQFFPNQTLSAPAPISAIYYDYALHDVGNIRLDIHNIGSIGNVMQPYGARISDSACNSEFPKYSCIIHLYNAGLFIGAVVGRDTLVSTFCEPYEFFPGPWPESRIRRKSMHPASPDYSPDARSEQDFITVYYDTLTDPGLVRKNEFDGRPHIPLGLKITQKSYAWSFEHVSDFIIFDYSIMNMGNKELKDVFVGLYVDGDLYASENFRVGAEDDLCGLIESFPLFEDFNFSIPVNTAYFIDNDGDPLMGAFTDRSPRSAAGIRLLGEADLTSDYSFNWWLGGYG
jgi:hypothetical protein